MRQPICEGCGVRIDTATQAHLQFVSGWKQKGKSSIKMPTYSDRFLHKTCLDSMDRAGATWTQEELPL